MQSKASQQIDISNKVKTHFMLNTNIVKIYRYDRNKYF